MKKYVQYCGLVFEGYEMYNAIEKTCLPKYLFVMLGNRWNINLCYIHHILERILGFLKVLQFRVLFILKKYIP